MWSFVFHGGFPNVGFGFGAQDEIQTCKLKFSMAQCSSRDKVRVSYFQRPGLRVGFRAWVNLGAQNGFLSLKSIVFLVFLTY